MIWPIFKIIKVVNVSKLTEAFFVDVSIYVSVTYLYSYGISRSAYQGICELLCVMYVWRLKRTPDVSTAFLPRSILICGSGICSVPIAF